LSGLPGDGFGGTSPWRGKRELGGVQLGIPADSKKTLQKSQKKGRLINAIQKEQGVNGGHPKSKRLSTPGTNEKHGC